jgi:hypothetical protein
MAMARWMKAHWPVLVAVAAAVTFVLWRLAPRAWEPQSLAEPGTRYADLDPGGSEGYDGQFALYVATNPSPRQVEAHLDVPAYRYQRILYPLAARVLALAREGWIPWSLLAVNLIAHLAGTWAVVLFLRDRRMWPGYALVYGLWVGLVAGVGLDLHEPLAYALVAWGWLARARSRPVLGAVLLGAAAFAKETTLLFLGAALLADVTSAEGRKGAAALSLAGLAFVGWQLWLWKTFGSPGLASGGEMATSFEWIPFMGFLRIGGESKAALALFGAVFGPTLIVPCLIGLAASVRALSAGDRSPESWALLLNAGVLLFLPFSTFREPLGLVRVATGLVQAVIYFSAARGRRRPLNYAMFWAALLVLLVPR